MPKPSQDTLRFIGEQIRKAGEERLYGKLVFIFENGTLKRVVREESIHPPK